MIVEMLARCSKVQRERNVLVMEIVVGMEVVVEMEIVVGMVAKLARHTAGMV